MQSHWRWRGNVGSLQQPLPGNSLSKKGCNKIVVHNIPSPSLQMSYLPSPIHCFKNVPFTSVGIKIYFSTQPPPPPPHLDKIYGFYLSAHPVNNIIDASLQQQPQWWINWRINNKNSQMAFIFLKDGCRDNNMWGEWDLMRRLATHCCYKIFTGEGPPT